MRKIQLALLSGLLFAGASFIVSTSPSLAHGGYDLDSIQGRWSYTEEWETGGQYHTSVGIFRFDGAGRCTLTYVVNDPTQTEQQHWEKSTCTYELGHDGRGSLRGAITPAEFVLTGHGKVITYVFNTPGVVGRGEMRRI